jgi:DNA-binding transcriptional MerR regulator
MAPLAKLPVISTVTNFFSAGGAKAGGFLKFLGKLFLPFTIIIGLVDTVKGFYAGFFGTDLEEGEEAPEGFIEKLMAGFEGGIKGLVNSIIGAPLDLLKGAVGFVLGKMGFTGAEEALASFRFSDILDQILSVIFNPIDSIVSLFRKIFDFDILGWLTQNVPGFGKIIDFFTEDDVEAQMRTIRQNRDAQNQIEYLQDRLDEAQAKLDDPNFSGNREYQEQIIRDRQALIDQVRAETGLTVEGIPARIQELQTMAEATEGGDRERLLNRIAELQELQTELEDRNVVIVNTDNKQTQVNNNKGTVSVGKETTPNDQTYKALQTQYAIP